MPDVPDREAILDQATRVADAITGGDQKFDAPLHLAGVAPTVMRATALLRSCAVMIENHEPAGVGILVRAIYEEWLFVTLWVEGTNDDRDRLLGAYYHSRAKLPQTPVAPEIVPPDDLQVKEWKILDRAKRLNEVLGNQAATDWYDLLFRTESHFSTHGGFDAANRFYAVQADGFQLLARPANDHSELDRLRAATAIVAELAGNYWSKVGLDPSPINAAVDWHED